MNEYSIECVDKLRIHELRDLAKNVGVASPTTLKKEELIAKITEAMQENSRLEMVGALPRKRRGLDFFSLLMPNNSDILNQMIAGGKVYNTVNGEIDCDFDNDESSNNTDFVYNENATYDSFTDNAPLFNFKVAQNEASYDVFEVAEGYLQIHSTGYGIVRLNGYSPSNQDVYLSCDFVNKHQLRSGDKVKGKVKIIVEDKPKIMYEIISVDGNAELSKLLKFESGKHNGLGETFYFDRFNINIKKGERTYIKNLKFDYALQLAEDLVDDNDVRVKVLNLRAMPEDKDVVGKDNLEVINCPFNMMDNNVISTIDLVLERIKREFEDNKPSVLIIYNFSGLLRVLNTSLDGFLEYDKFDVRAINKVLNIMYSAKFVDNTHHLSIIFVDRNEINPMLNSAFEAEFKPLFNNIIDASEGGFFN